MNAARRSREAVKASNAIAYWVGTSREIEARAAAGRKHIQASMAHWDAGNAAQSRAHLRTAEALKDDIERLTAKLIADRGARQ